MEKEKENRLLFIIWKLKNSVSNLSLKTAAFKCFGNCFLEKIQSKLRSTSYSGWSMNFGGQLSSEKKSRGGELDIEHLGWKFNSGCFCDSQLWKQRWLALLRIHFWRNFLINSQMWLRGNKVGISKIIWV
jgi:hypothetical protein